MMKEHPEWRIFHAAPPDFFIYGGKIRCGHFSGYRQEMFGKLGDFNKKRENSGMIPIKKLDYYRKFLYNDTLCRKGNDHVF